MTRLQLAALTMLSLIMWGFIGAGYAVAEGMISAQEDDKLWNCYLMGNHQGGPDVPWHGFINL